MSDPPSAQASTPRPAGAFGRDVGVLTLVRFAATGAGFLTSVLAARVLGPSELGSAGVGLTIGSIAALIANGGLNIATTYYLGRRPDERRVITQRSMTLAVLAVLLAVGLVLVIVRPIARNLFGADDLALVLATAVVAGGVVGYEIGGGILLGLDRRGPYVIEQVIEGVGSFVVTAFVLLVVAPTAAGMVAAAGIAYLAAMAYSFTTAHRTVGGRLGGFDRTFTREALTMGLRGQVGNVLQFLNLRLDLLLVPLLLDLRAAGIYLIAVRMSEVVTQIASAAAALLFPAVSRTELTRTDLTERTVRATLLVVVIAGLGIALFAPWLLTTFFGPAFEAGTAALRITMLAMLPLSLSRLLAADLKGRGRAGLVSIAAGSGLIATVALDLLLIPVLGIEGAAIASLLAYSASAITVLVAFKAVTGGSLWRLVPRPADARSLVAGARQVIAARRPGRAEVPPPA